MIWVRPHLTIGGMVQQRQVYACHFGIVVCIFIKFRVWAVGPWLYWPDFTDRFKVLETRLDPDPEKSMRVRPDLDKKSDSQPCKKVS